MVNPITVEPASLSRFETEHFLLLAERDSFAARDLSVVGTRLEAAYSAVVELLDLHIVPVGRIEVVIHSTDSGVLTTEQGAAAAVLPREWSGPPWQVQLLYLPDRPAPELEEAVTNLLLACAAGPFSERTPMLVHGLLRHAAEVRSGAASGASERLAERRRKGVHVGVSPSGSIRATPTDQRTLSTSGPWPFWSPSGWTL